MRAASSDDCVFIGSGDPAVISERGQECVDMFTCRERSHAHTQSAIGKRSECAVNVGGTVEAGPNGNVEARVEDLAQILRGKAFGRDQGERATWVSGSQRPATFQPSAS